MNQPSISVLIPCYNGLPFVVEAVQSVVAQADEGVECVVVDDGSTDGSADTLEQHFGSRIRVIRQPNGGPSVARNRALAECRGDLIIWFDADDLLAPNTLELRRRAFADSPNLEMLLGVNEIFYMESGERHRSPRSHACDESYLVNGLLGRRDLPHLNVITFRRTALERIGGFDPRFPISQDYDLWLRAWSCLRWRFVDVVLAYQREGSYERVTLRRGKIFNYGDTGKVLLKNRRLMQETLGSDAPWRRAYAGFATDFALVLLNRHRRREAFAWASRACSLVGPKVESRTVKYLLEAVLATNCYATISAVVKGLHSVVRRERREEIMTSPLRVASPSCSGSAL
jgi:glycosyltransferase involved in cell wall biosynthesis